MHKGLGMFAFVIVVIVFRKAGIQESLVFLGTCIALAGFMAGGTK